MFLYFHHNNGYNDHFQNFKRYGIPKAQLVIADIPYNVGNNAYGSNPSWYIEGDNKKGESQLAGKSFFDTDKNFNINEFFHFCSNISLNQVRILSNCFLFFINALLK